ncbi:MAG: hypothetical protein ACOH2K_16510 [Burkholderiaceae bacterium]
MSKLVLSKKKFILPPVSAQAMALPAIAAFHAAVQQAADETNSLLEENKSLTRELARLKKTKKKASRNAR